MDVRIILLLPILFGCTTGTVNNSIPEGDGFGSEKQYRPTPSKKHPKSRNGNDSDYTKPGVSSGESVAERQTEESSSVISTNEFEGNDSTITDTEPTISLENHPKNNDEKHKIIFYDDCVTCRCTCSSCDEIDNLTNTCIHLKENCKGVTKKVAEQKSLDLFCKSQKRRLFFLNRIGVPVCIRLPILRNSECRPMKSSSTKYTSTQVPSTRTGSHEGYQGSTDHYSDSKQTRTRKGVSKGILVRVVVILLVVIIVVLSTVLCRKKCPGKGNSLKSPNEQPGNLNLRTVNSGRMGNQITARNSIQQQQQNYMPYRPGTDNEYMRLQLPDGITGNDSSPSVDYLAQKSQVMGGSLETSNEGPSLVSVIVPEDGQHQTHGIQPQTTSDSRYDYHEYSYPDDPLLAHGQVPERRLLKLEEHFAADHDYDVLQENSRDENTITDQSAEYNILQNTSVKSNRPDTQDEYKCVRRLQPPVNVKASNDCRILKTDVNNAPEESHAVAELFQPIYKIQAIDHRDQTTTDHIDDDTEYLYPYDHLLVQAHVPDAQTRCITQSDEHFFEDDDYNVLHVKNDGEMTHDL